MSEAERVIRTGRALDELATLDDERALLLRSIADLKAEHAAGDLDDRDFLALKDDYVARTAAVIRRRHDLEAGIERRREHARAATPRWRKPVAVVATAAAALGAGVLVARSAGERVGTQGLTGTVNAAGANRSADVSKLLKQAQDLLSNDVLASLKAYDEVLQIDPQNPEAIAYGGWLLRIVAQSAEGSTRDELITRAKTRLDAAVTVAPEYPDARAFRGVLLLRDLNDPVAATKDFDALDALDPPPFVTQLVASAKEEAASATSATPRQDGTIPAAP